MRVFITGGTGFIGRALVHRLTKDGHSAIVWTRNPQGARSKFEEGVEFVQSGDGQALTAALERADAVVNLAGEPVLPGRWTPSKRAKLVSSRVDLTRRLVEAIAQVSAKPRVLVSASAVGYYGQDSGPEKRAESAPPADDFLAQLCVDWEAEANKAQALGLRVVRVRIGLVLGPEGGALAQLLGPFKAGVGGRIGSGTQYMPWIHLRDLVSMIAAGLYDDGFPPVVNGTAPAPVTNREFTKTLGRVLGRPTVLPVPSLALKLAFGDAAGALLGGQNAVPEAALAHGFRFAFDTLDDCLREVLQRPAA